MVFQPGAEQVQFGRTFRIMEDGETGYMVELRRDGSFIPAVAFCLHYAEESDFEMSNYYTSSYPLSPFVKRLMCTIPTPEGRYTIRDKSFKIEKNGIVTEQILQTGTFPGVLQKYFGIRLSADMQEHIGNYLDHASDSPFVL